MATKTVDSLPSIDALLDSFGGYVLLSQYDPVTNKFVSVKCSVDHLRLFLLNYPG